MHQLLLADTLKFTISVLLYLSRISTTNSKTPFVKNSPTSCVSSLYILVNNTYYILADIDGTVLIRIFLSSSRTIISILKN